MNFLRGSILFWLLLIPAMLFLFCRASRRKRGLLRQILGARSSDPSSVTVSYGVRTVRCGLLLLAAALLLVAAARPWWGTVSTRYTSSGRDIMTLFDVSRSMLATDVAPSRLQHAQYLLKELVNANPGDRFGLVAFAGESFLECPLTSDRVSFLQYVDELSPESIPVGGTNLERALRTADEAFRASEGNFRAVLLFTDGDELDGRSERAAAALREKRIPLFVCGLGDPGVPALVPEPGGGFKRDSSGELVRTRLAEDTLRKLAAGTGGIYVRSTALESGFDAIERRIRDLAPVGRAGGTRSAPVERFPYFLAGAGILLLLYFLLNDRRSAIFVLLIALASPAFGGPSPGDGGDGPPGAAASSKDEEGTDAGEADAVRLYNRSLERQRQGRSDVSDGYAKAIRGAGGNTAVVGRSFFNLGVARHTEGREHLAQARRLLQSQQLDGASEELEKARRLLSDVSELYARALSYPDKGAGAVSPGGNLQHLHDDSDEVETLAKQIADLERQRQQAVQETRKAKEQNGRRNGADGGGQDPSASAQMDRARRAAQELQRRAHALQQQKMSDAADSASGKIRQAEQAAAQKQTDAADRLLGDALKDLDPGAHDGSSEEKRQSGGQDGNGSDGADKDEGANKAEENESGKDGGGRNGPDGAGKAGADPRGTPQEEKLDRQSADRMLEIMAAQEKDLREAMKRRGAAGRPRVERDW